MREKLWTKEFDKLLAELQPLIGGTIRLPAPPDPEMARAVPSSVWLYPTLVTRMSDRRVEFTLSDIPAGRMLDVSGAVDEYLHFHVYSKIETSFSVTLEGVFTRFRKFIRFDQEFETGNASFDDEFYLNPRDSLARAKLKEPAIQQTIASLAPIVLLNVDEGGIFLSRGVEAAEDLNTEAVQKTFTALISLVELLS